ncbi:amino acid adenylation domain-containing protein [Dyella mobilis]|uniref:Amino acid adenylation domain-containing protein n=2 Tax=Dyella mobilis TaxID=1849582 RepID=A0ABS2KAV3_9GAMM|nr:amino acid adenylation domain-containing protein [Dyella mobilis]
MPLRQEPCIHELFEQQVLRVPDAIAVVFGDQSLSYAQLNVQANRLAHYLIARGVRPDDRIAICMERSIELVVGLLAILKSGAAYVPLDPIYSSDRLSLILGDAKPALLLCDAPGCAALGDDALANLHVVHIDAEQPQWATWPDVDPDTKALALTSRHLAYIIYTSGSTGTPKGVMVEHAQVVRLFAATDHWFGFSEHDVWCLFHSFAFDFSVWELWGALHRGGRLVIVPHDVARNVHEFHGMVCEQGVTVLNQTPSAFRAFVDVQARGARADSLRYVIFGGEALEPSILRDWYANRSDQSPQLINMYGITETTVHVTYRALRAADVTVSGSPIGRRIPDLRIYLLDAYGQPVPRGVIGELYVGGAGVARGYLNRPELTAERFLIDPFSASSGARMYRTGDLARYLPDGGLEFLGRNDHQVKIRGFRIELGEIEARLTEHESIREAVVIAREDVPGDKRLVAYLTTVAPADELAALLRAHLSARLPDYMVPSAFVQLASLPLTPNGKLDRKALPAPGGDAYALRAYEPPQGEIEQTLAGLWEELLGIDRVGRHDNFFELGGQSLLAVQLMAQLRRLGLGTEVRALFAMPVLCDLAATLGSYREVVVPANRIDPQCTVITPDLLPLIELNQGDIDRIVARVPGGIANIQDVYALSPLQEGILFHHVLATEGDPYLLVSQMAFADRALLDRYLAAVQRVVDRHDILRTGIVWEGLSRPAQVVLKQATIPVTTVELDPQDGPIHEQLARRFDPRRHRIDLTRAPLLQLVVARDAENERWLLLELQHHLIGDHSTSEFLLAEVQAFLAGRGDALPVAQPFRNLIAQARSSLPQAEHVHFFRGMLADIDEPTTPFGLSEVRRDGSRVEEAHYELPEALNRRLRTQARRLGVNLASLCHLAWGQVVAKTSGRESVVFGTVLFGRMHGGEGADQAMGLFINTLPLRLDLDGTDVVASVRATHARLAELLRHEHASLALAQRCSGVAAAAPLFSALLNYVHNSLPPSAQTSWQGQGIERLSFEERTNYPFTLIVEDSGDALGLIAQIVQPVSAARVCRFVHRALEQLVDALESAPHTPVRQLDVLPPEERSSLLTTWNRTDATYPQDRCMHQLFERQVQSTPEAVAIVCGDRSLTYAQLNAQANRLAHHLIALGTQPDDRIAICVERRIPMVAGLLAVLKAGAAYVPLDPAYPSERLASILRDAQPRLLLGDARGRQALGEEALASLLVFDPDAGQPEWMTRPDVDPDAEALGLKAGHLAYIIYTSGSTGVPKGVMIEHAQAVNFLHWSGDAFAPKQFAQTLFSTSINFDLSVYECFAPLAWGGTIFLADNALALMQKPLEVSLINTVPSAIGALLDVEAVPPAVRTINLAGEPLKTALAEKIFANTSVMQICNLYGPSETTTYSTWSCMRRGGPVTESIGRPIANTRIYLLDAHGQPVPLGVVGELYIGGAGVARGYLNRPDLTAERFLDDPYSPHADARMYRTGDLARYLPDGNLEFLGRNDHQVKIRGFRIELGEIEARLAEHPQVREAVVLAREDVPGDKRLVAYVTVNDAGSEASKLIASLRAYLSSRLPDYMQPSAFVALATLPLTPNGKLDRGAFPAPDHEAYALHAYEPPQGEVEEELAAIWEELLGVDRIGRHDDFFESGGHSILAMRLLNYVENAFDITVNLSTLFGNSKLSAFAEQVLLASISQEFEADELQELMDTKN